jgi:hypothetical protein
MTNQQPPKGIKTIEELPDHINEALADALQVWADEYLEGRPAIVGYVIYGNMQKALIKETNRMLEFF